MIKLTKNFSLSEFECKCGCVMPELVRKNIEELAGNLQVLREATGRLNITNAYRCKEHNAAVGGVRNSQHLFGKAADVKSNTLNPSEVASIVDGLMEDGRFKIGGIGIYNTFTHVDIRGNKARWNKKIKK